MDYKERYEQALEKARKLMNKGYDVLMPEIFPELQEDKDERIRKELTEFLKSASGGFLNSAIQCETFGEWLAWLEKQGEKLSVVNFKAKDWYVSKVDGKIHNIYENSTNNDEPKFKVGDWVVNKGQSYLIADIDYEQRRYLFEIGGYTHEQLNWEYIENADNKYHLWTIADANDGDVLISPTNKKPFVYNGNHTSNSLGAYFGLNHKGELLMSDSHGNNWTSLTSGLACVHPTTKEQRDLLFQKMKDAGYEWDSEKKELRKIESKALDADKVIEWIDEHVPTKFEDMQNYVNQFKQDFGL